ncbi:MAG: hypothetical protein VXY92_13450 [Planctomycetota bacterium]|nr:hypothetical protein [Planctomycetota bacterium]
MTRAVDLPPGTRIAAATAGAFPEQPAWAAVRTWWRESIAQTRRWSVATARTTETRQLLLRYVDETGELTASLLGADTELPLASRPIPPAADSAQLSGALDRLAWAARLALGEQVSRPVPVALVTSADPRVVAAVDDAAALVETGAFADAYAALRSARRLDGGAPFVLSPLAALELLRGEAAQAQAISREAARYPARCAPTTQHQIARTLLLASAALAPTRAHSVDLELRRFARVARGERPHDDEVIYTEALALNFLGDFAAAKPLLEALHKRQPQRAFIAYHLGWACLGTGEADAAARHLAAAGRTLPTPWMLLPRCIALYAAGRGEELAEVLEDAAASTARGRVMTHQVLRMQAAHALLDGRPEDARARLVANLRHLVQNPLELDQRAGEFAEAGAVLIRIGGAPELPALLAAAQKLPIQAATKDAVAFVGGMDQIARTGRRSRPLEASLSRNGASAWGLLLAAYAHEREGEVGAMQTALARAARLSSSPMTKALLAKSLRSVGKAEEADRLRDTLRREMLEFHLRARCLHPIFGPELAYAFLVR